MKTTTTLGFAISLLLGSQTTYALTPWTDGAPIGVKVIVAF